VAARPFEVVRREPRLAAEEERARVARRPAHGLVEVVARLLEVVAERRDGPAREPAGLERAVGLDGGGRGRDRGVEARGRRLALREARERRRIRPRSARRRRRRRRRRRALRGRRSPREDERDGERRGERQDERGERSSPAAASSALRAPPLEEGIERRREGRAVSGPPLGVL